MQPTLARLQNTSKATFACSAQTNLKKT